MTSARERKDPLIHLFCAARIIGVRARRRIEDEGMKYVNAICRNRDRSRFDIFPGKKKKTKNETIFNSFLILFCRSVGRTQNREMASTILNTVIRTRAITVNQFSIQRKWSREKKSQFLHNSARKDPRGHFRVARLSKRTWSCFSELATR